MRQHYPSDITREQFMDEAFIRNRITELRQKKGVSEYKMSIDMAHSKSYIQGITSGGALPSMSEFLFMCEYLGVTPREFFDDTIDYNPTLLRQTIEVLQTLSDDDLNLILSNAKRLKGN